MKRLHAVTSLAALLSLAACASTPKPIYMDGAAGNPMAAEQRLLDRQASAQAASFRPGDDQLSCPQLELELMQISSDPVMLAAMASNAANAKAITDSTNATAATMTGLSALSMASSLPVQVPGLNMLGSAVGYAQQAQMQAQMDKQDQIMDSMMKNMDAMQPGIYRRLRVMELANARGCKFVNEY